MSPRALLQLEEHNLLMTLHTTGETRLAHRELAQRAYDARQDLLEAQARAEHYGREQESCNDSGLWTEAGKLVPHPRGGN